MLIGKVILGAIGLLGFLFWPTIFGMIYQTRELFDYIQIIWILIIVAGMWYIEYKDRGSV